MDTDTTPATAGPGLLERLGRRTEELLARDGWSRERLLAHQARRLRALIGHAVANSPWYRDTLGPHAADRPLSTLATLSKASLMDHFDEVVCDPRLRRADLEAHMAGPDPARSYLGRYRVLTTSGTTGLRGIVALTEDEAVTWIAATMRAGVRAGFGPRARVVGIATPSPLHLTRQLFAPLRDARSRDGQAPPDLSAATPLPELVAALNAYQPEALVGYPSVAGLLADEQLAGRLRIAPRAGAFGAEPLTPNLRRRIRAAWGFEPASLYAATESPVIASSTPRHPELEVHEDVVLVEVVDERGRPVPPGRPGAKVLVTNLVNFAQPLIRYELTDAVTLAAGPNPTGRPWRRIAAVEGRSEEVLHLPARGGGRAAVHPSALEAALAPAPEVRQYQFLYDGRALQALVVLAPDAPAGTPDRLRHALERAIEATGAWPLPVQVRPVAALQREPGPGHKLKLVKSTSPDGSGPVG